ncbi:MAG: biotin transporter BioY [Candidatus Faecivivens sp.]|nr:biotin transporter BioY [Candidatus Faecivivens sp.]
MKKNSILTLTRVALCAALIMACSYIVIPIPFSTVPVTAQTLAIALTGLLLKSKEAGSAVVVYILLAAVLGRFTFGPSIGYFVGFLVSAVVISLIKGQKNNVLRFFLAAAAAIVITNTLGSLGMMLVAGTPIGTAFFTGFVVFLPGDIVKAIAAALIAVPVRKALSHTAALA